MLAAAAVVPCVFGYFLYDGYDLPKLVAAAVFVAVASALRTSPGRATPLDAPLLGLLGAALLSATLAPDPAPSFLGGRDAYAWALVGWLPCLLLYRLAAAGGRRFAAALPLWIAAGAVPVSLYALAQSLGLDPLMRGLLPGGRAISTIGSPVALGVFLAAAFPCALHAYASGRRRFGAAAAAILAAALAVAASRAGWLAAACAGALYAALALPREQRRTPRLAAAAALLLALAAYGGTRLARSRSDLERVETWRTAARLFAERPVLGFGPEGFDLALRAQESERFARSTAGSSSAEQAHDDWLHVLACLGLLGALAYLWLHLRGFELVRYALARGLRAPAAALIAGLAALFVAIKFNPVYWILVFAASLMAGGLVALSRPRADGKAAGVSARGTILALAALAVVGWLACADRFERLGLRARAAGRPQQAARWLEAALSWNPWDVGYRMNLDNLLWDAADAAPPEARRLLLLRAGVVGEEAVLRRPRHPDAHRLAGLAALHWAEAAPAAAAPPAFAHAREELLEAVRLDPYFPPLLREAARACRGAGDAAGAAALEQRLTRLLEKR